jgi:hypothetical protein
MVSFVIKDLCSRLLFALFTKGSGLWDLLLGNKDGCPFFAGKEITKTYLELLCGWISTVTSKSAEPPNCRRSKQKIIIKKIQNLKKFA